MRLTFEIAALLLAAGTLGHMLAVMLEWNLRRKD